MKIIGVFVNNMPLLVDNTHFTSRYFNALELVAAELGINLRISIRNNP